MKKVANSFTLRIGIATALSLSFVIYLPLRVVSARAAHVNADLKSESQFRSEAARYDAAIRAIAGIATMKLETGADLKNALDILKRESPNLKLHRSKLVVVALNDSTLMGAVKKKAPDKQAAERFARELNAAPNGVLKLDGAESVKTQMLRGRDVDVATLKRAAEKLKEAAEKIKTRRAGSSPRYGTTDEFKIVRASLRSEEQPLFLDHAHLALPLDPVGLVVLSILTAVFVAAVLYPIAFAILLPIVEIFTTKDPDELAECQDRADNRLSDCLVDAGSLTSGFPFFEREAAIALCYVQRLQSEALCLLIY